MNEKTKTIGKRFLIGFALVLAVGLIAARLYLGVWVLDYVNRTLAQIPGYQGSVAGIDIHLCRGAYSIDHLVINKVDGKIPTPFVAIDKADLSIQWSSLFHGRIVSSVELVHPVINFAVKDKAEQTGGNVDWTKPIKDLAPIDINYVKIEDGAVTYQDFSSTPRVDVYIHHMQGEVHNLRNVTKPDVTLPSRIDIAGDSIGHGRLKIGGRMNILKQIPDMDILLSLEKVNLPALNNFTHAYAAFDFKSGDFNLYSNLIVKNNHVSGYMKPIVTDLSVDVFKEANPIVVVWSTVVAGVLQLFTNLPKDQFATRIDLDGSLDHVNTDTWSAIWGVLSNAFISAMTKGFEQTDTKGLVQPKEGSPTP